MASGVSRKPDDGRSTTYIFSAHASGGPQTCTTSVPAVGATLAVARRHTPSRFNGACLRRPVVAYHLTALSLRGTSVATLVTWQSVSLLRTRSRGMPPAAGFLCMPKESQQRNGTRARRVKQTCRWHVCSQSGEQAVLATWAKVSRDPRSKPEPGCITIRRPHPRCAVRSGVRCRYGIPLTNAVLLTNRRLPAWIMSVSLRRGRRPAASR